MYFLYKLDQILMLFRVKQWIKNLFVFAPLIFSGQLLNTQALLAIFYTAFIFCLASATVYIVNDIKDVDSDRKHHQKSTLRPIASNIISIKFALVLLFSLYFLLLMGLFFLAPQITWAILSYIILNLAYTFWLKNWPVLDIFSIALCFVLRVYAGALALNLQLSSWMFITTFCLALYLAAIKRRQELLLNGSRARNVLNKYSISLLERYAEMSATGALVFYSMFVISSKPSLVITIPFVLFGLYRYWYLVEQLGQGESPSDALFDMTLMITVVIWISACCFLLS